MKLNALALCALGLAGPLSAEVFTSPNGRVSCDFALRDGVPVAVVSYDGARVFESELGFNTAKLSLRTSDTRTVARAWKPVWGFRSEYPENYVECTVSLGRPGVVREEERLEMRCYDEGFAVRATLVKNAYGLDSVASERTTWRFATGAKAWCIAGTEDTFPATPYDLTKLNPKCDWRMPFTVELAGGGAACIHEADVRDFPRSYLRAQKGALRPAFVLGVKEGRGLFVSPWRAVQLAADANKLVETAYFIENLNAPCALNDTAWIRPGLSVSDHGNCGLDTKAIIAAAREAKKFGATSFQIDWGWYGTEYAWSDADREAYLAAKPDMANEKTWRANTYADPYKVAKGYVPYHPYGFLNYGRSNVNLDIPKIVAELRKMDMGLGLYVHGSILEAHDLDTLFATYESWGVAALKPGFVSYGSQRATDFLRAMAATAAKHHLWLDIHDAHIPDGFERTYPNVMITEGVGGEEGDHPVRQDVALPFTRNLCGPLDFTPELFKVGKSKSSKAHKVALFLAYHGPTAIMRGSTRKVLATDASIVEFIRALPWNYDETRVLEGAIARHFTVARRRGNDWYLAGLAGDDAHTTTLDFDFLPEDRAYTLTLWRDVNPDDITAVPPRGYTRETRTVRRGDRIDVSMAPAGGFVALVKDEPSPSSP